MFTRGHDRAESSLSIGFPSQNVKRSVISCTAALNTLKSSGALFRLYIVIVIVVMVMICVSNIQKYLLMLKIQKTVRQNRAFSRFMRI